MGEPGLHRVIDWLRRCVLPDVACGELLERFVKSRADDAFAELVRRHGPKVYAVCRRILGDHQLAEDAFQATFVVLARNARTVQPRSAVGGFLYGVAQKTALKAFAMRRRRKETLVPVPLESSFTNESATSGLAPDVLAMLNEEIANLSAAHRAAVVLCEIDSVSRADAARQLGIGEGTLSSRLARARERLRKQLLKRGVTLSSGMLVSLAASARASVPPSLMSAAGQILTKSLSPTVETLVQGYLAMTALSKLKSLAVVVGAAMLVWGLGSGIFGAHEGLPPAQAERIPEPREAEQHQPDLQKAADAKHAPAQAAKPRTDFYGDPLPDGAIMRLGTTRWRPSGFIGHMAFSSDEKRLISWQTEDGGFFAAFDAANGRIVELSDYDYFYPPTGPLYFLDDGRVFWTDTEQCLNEYHTKDSKSKFKFVAAARFNNTTRAEASAVSPDGKSLIGCQPADRPDKERDVFIWDLEKMKEPYVLPTPRRLGSVPRLCESLLFSPDGRTIVALCQPPEQKDKAKACVVATLDAATGKEQRRFETSRYRYGMNIALSSRYLAFGLEDEAGTVLLWDLHGGQDKQLTSGHGKKSPYPWFGVSALVFSHDGATLVTGGRDGCVRVWDTADLKLRQTIGDANPHWIEALALTRDGKRLAVAGSWGIIRNWDLTTGESPDVNNGCLDFVTGVQFTPAGDAVTLSNDRRLSIWNPHTGDEKHRAKTPATIRYWPSLGLAPDGQTLVLNVAGQLFAKNASDGDERPLPKSLADLPVDHSVFGVDGKTLLAVRGNGVSLFDWTSGTVRRNVTVPPPENMAAEVTISMATISPDGRWLVTLANRAWKPKDDGSRGDSVLDLWNATTGDFVRRLAHDSGHYVMMFTPDGKLLLDTPGARVLKLRRPGGQAEIELRGDLHLVDVVTGELIRSFEEPPPLLNRNRYTIVAALAPDGRSIYSGGNDGVIHISETATGNLRRSLSRHRGMIQSMSVSLDGRRLLTGSRDLTALVWDVSLSGHTPVNTAPLTTADTARLWETLASPDAKLAYEAMLVFAAHPKGACAAIRASIQPAGPNATDAVLDRIFTDFFSDSFAVRDRAARELDELGERGVSGMRVRLATAPPLETRRRIEQFLDKYDPDRSPRLFLLQSRALEILEHINNLDSRIVLADLAKGAREARLTREATAALARQREDRSR